MAAEAAKASNGYALAGEAGRSWACTLSGRLPNSPPALLHKAVEQFNAGLFWECHETLEDLWLVTPYPLRHFYQGVLKIAVGFHHSDRHNVRGCRNKLGEGLRLLKVFTPSFLGLDTGALAVETDRWLQE